MTVLHSGSTKKFAAGWEGIFARRSAKGAATLKTTTRSNKLATAPSQRTRRCRSGRGNPWCGRPTPIAGAIEQFRCAIPRRRVTKAHARSA